MSYLRSVGELVNDWLLLQWSREKVSVAVVFVPIAMLISLSLPSILLMALLWWCYARLLVCYKYGRGKLMDVSAFIINRLFNIRSVNSKPLSDFIDDKSAPTNNRCIPGSVGLPLIGETVSFLANPVKFLYDRRNRYGDVFHTSIDFSGTFLAARKVCCVFESSTTFSSAIRTRQHLVVSRTQLHRSSRDTHHSNSQVQSSQHLHNTTLKYGSGNSYYAEEQGGREGHHKHSPMPLMQMKMLGYAGLFGSSCYGGVLIRTAIPALFERVMNNTDLLDQWEDRATPIIQRFLRRLTYEGCPFSFTERVSELACELMGAVFLNMTGYSPSLHKALDEYLVISCNHTALNASLSAKKEILQSLNAAIFEENKRFLSREWAESFADVDSQCGESKMGGGILGALLDISAEILKQQESLFYGYTNKSGRRKQASTFTPISAIQLDLLFVFLVEFVYPMLVEQLRSTATSIIREQSVGATGSVKSGGMRHNSITAVCKESYKSYLTARQLVGNLSESGLARFSWASTLIPDDEFEGANHSEVRVWGDETERTAQSKCDDVIASPLHPFGTETPSAPGPCQSSIGRYLLSQLSWPESPISTFSASNPSVIANKDSGARFRGITEAYGVLPVATSCVEETIERREELSSSPADSELEYSVSSRESQTSNVNQSNKSPATLPIPRDSLALGSTPTRHNYSIVTPHRSGTSRSSSNTRSKAKGRAFYKRSAVPSPLRIMSTGKTRATSCTEGSEAGTPSRTSWRYREHLIIKYVTSIKELVTQNKEKCTTNAALHKQKQAQFTLSLCQQNFLVNAGACHSSMHLEKGDLVLQVYPQEDMFAHTSLGLFSDLVLSIFSHELVTGYDWDLHICPPESKRSTFCRNVLPTYEVVHRKLIDPSPVSRILNVAALLANDILPPTYHLSFAHAPLDPPNQNLCNSVSVRKFRTSAENIAFLVKASPECVDSGLDSWNGDRSFEDDDTRYFSDGL